MAKESSSASRVFAFFHFGRSFRYEQPEDPMCPVKSFEIYLSKLSPKSDSLFQQPKSSFTQGEWYNGRPHGVNAISGFMSKISKAAGLSQSYTNHCLRATAVTVLGNSGVSAPDIIAVSGHKNVQSLIPYQRSISDSKRYSMSSVLASYGKWHDSQVVSTASSVQMSSVSAQSTVSGILRDNTFNAHNITLHVTIQK